jgi:FlaA1/EpsC-like NDP-sugar epimerase
MNEELKGKNILITGGTGSIGFALVQKLLRFEPNVVRVFSNDEDELYALGQKLEMHENIRLLLGDLRDISRLRRAIENIDMVFHLAALKHVPMCEYNPFEAVQTNVLGTQNLIEVAIAEEVNKVIFTSSDKAASPANVLGATKLLAEKLITAANYYKGSRKTVFSSVRFGNVLGSRGSIIPLLKMQIENYKKVTITDSNMTRFIMPMDRTIELMLKAVKIMLGGEVFVFKMPAVKIADLVDVVTNMQAFRGDYKSKEIKVEIVGTRSGEKLYEELMSEEEARRAVEIGDILVVLPHITELFDRLKDYYVKMGAKPVQLKPYSSRESALLSKEQIKKLLTRSDIS